MAGSSNVHPGRLASAAAVGSEHREANDLVRASAIVGILAGAAMLAWASGSAALEGLSASRPLVLTAATLHGDAAEGGPGALALGGLLWALVSVALALLYGSIIPRDFPFVSAALIGVGYAFVVMAVATSAVLPWLNPEMRSAMPETGGAWVLGYAVFGFVLGFVPRMRRWIRA